MYEYLAGFIIFWISYTILSLAQYQSWLISSFKNGTLFTDYDLLFEVYNSYAFIGPSSRMRWYLDEHFIVAVISSILITYIIINTIKIHNKTKNKQKLRYIEFLSIISYLILIPSIAYCNTVDGFAHLVLNIFHVIQGFFLALCIVLLFILAYYTYKLKNQLNE